jgi:hypothetical protein
VRELFEIATLAGVKPCVIAQLAFSDYAEKEDFRQYRAKKGLQEDRQMTE